MLQTTRSRSLAIFAAGWFSANAPAFAATALQTMDCDASSDRLNCTLQSILHFLYGAAGVLALILLMVIAVAVQIYRKNRQPPKDRR